MKRLTMFFLQPFWFLSQQLQVGKALAPDKYLCPSVPVIFGQGSCIVSRAEGSSSFASSSREEEQNQRGLLLQKWPLMKTVPLKSESVFFGWGYLGLWERVVLCPRWPLVTQCYEKQSWSDLVLNWIAWGLVQVVCLKHRWCLEAFVNDSLVECKHPWLKSDSNSMVHSHLNSHESLACFTGFVTWANITYSTGT